MEPLALVMAFVVGMATGILSGLTPGLHVNVAAALLAASAPVWTSLGVPPLAAAVGIVTAAVAHAFFQAVPSLFLGVPSDEAYALLPAHRLVRRGRGLEALGDTLSGAMWGLVLGLTVVAGLLALEARGLPLASSVDGLLRPWMGWLLTGISLLLIATDTRSGWALVVFLASGLLGLVVFASPLFPGEGAAFGALFPALTGLFGASGLLLALRDPGASLPRQDETSQPSHVPWSAALAGLLGGMAVGLLPGLGAGNAAALASLRRRGPETESSGRRYLVMVSSINLADALFGIAALALLARSRSGASAALETFFPEPGRGQLLTLGLAMLAAGLVCQQLLRGNGLRLARLINHLHPGGLNGATLVFLVLLVAWTTGVWGLVLLAAASLLGLVAPLSGARRAQAMGFFLVPTILFFSGRSAEVASALRLEGASLPPPEASPGWLALGLVLAVAAGWATYQALKRWRGTAAERRAVPDEPDDPATLPDPGATWARPSHSWRRVGMAAVLASLLLVVGWAWLAWGVTRPGATFHAEALSVTDGDTVWVRVWPNRVLEVRFKGVDCPESGQVGGPEARRFTADRVLGRDLEIRSHGLDRYGRTLGRVFVDGVDLNLALVQAGQAWHSKRYSSEAALASAETQARVQRIGLWRQASPMPPWEFRRLARHPRATSLPPEPTAPSDAASAPPESPDAPGPLHGNTRSMVFHRPGCRNYDCKNCTAVFKDAAEAAAAGYQQAGCCRPLQESRRTPPTGASPRTQLHGRSGLPGLHRVLERTSSKPPP